MAWHQIEHELERTANQSALSGKWYIIMWLCVRMLLLLQLTTRTFSGELGDFDCDTQVPGCTQLCFNRFSPMSVPRYWMLQLICSAVPPIIFIIYATHTLDRVQEAAERRRKIRERQQRDIKKVKALDVEINSQLEAAVNEKQHQEDHIGELNVDEVKDVFVRKTYYESNVPFGMDKDTPGKLVTAYFWSLVCKLAIEIAFSVGQYYIYPYHFVMDTVYECSDVYPCMKHVTSCWPVRPFEKTFAICIWYATTTLQVFIGCFEISSFGMRRVVAGYQNTADITKEFR